MDALPSPKRLAVFDFDYTVVASNTDTVAAHLLKPEPIPEEAKKVEEKDGWNRYMEEIFKLLHKKDIRRDKIMRAIREIPEVPGFVRCLKTLRRLGFDLIVISDSNSEFIAEWANSHGLQDTFDAVYTNPAWFEDSGLLRIKPYHIQTECKLSGENLCKGKVLQEHLKRKQFQGVEYETVFYAGDGTNDICPILRLAERDYGCPRADFSMDKMFKKNDKLKSKVKAKLLYWRTGFELLSEITAAIGIEDDN